MRGSQNRRFESRKVGTWAVAESLVDQRVMGDVRSETTMGHSLARGVS
jgi:hypothetical protein